MKGDEAKLLLGFAPNSRPTPSQVKAAYKRKVWECHPDLFPAHHKKPLAESNFKLMKVYGLHIPIKGKGKDLFRLVRGISEAYTFLLSGGSGEYLSSATYSRVMKTGVPRAQGGSYRNHALIQMPFLFLVLGTVALGGFNASRAYKKQKEAFPSHNPFLP